VRPTNDSPDPKHTTPDEEEDVLTRIVPNTNISISKERHKDATQCRPDQSWWWQNGIHVATVFTVLLYTTFAALQWRANQKAADAAHDAAATASRQLEMADRPWIKESITVDVPFASRANAGASWAVLIKATNVGHSVATGVFASAELIAPPLRNYFDEPLTYRKNRIRFQRRAADDQECIAAFLLRIPPKGATLGRQDDSNVGTERNRPLIARREEPGAGGLRGNPTVMVR
jgi:hypothetical protein